MTMWTGWPAWPPQASWTVTPRMARVSVSRTLVIPMSAAAGSAAMRPARTFLPPTRAAAVALAGRDGVGDRVPSGRRLSDPLSRLRWPDDAYLVNGGGRPGA